MLQNREIISVGNIVNTVVFRSSALCSVPQSCLTLPPHGLQPARLPCPWDSPGKNPGVGAIPSSRDLPDPGINPGLLYHLHWQADSLPLSHLGSPQLEIQEILTPGVIRTSSGWASSLVMVPNQGHKIRFCVDYKK